MTSHSFPIDIDSVDTSRSGAFGLLIRHGEREPFTKETAMFEAKLTEAGKEQARQLGLHLKGRRPHAFYSSPADRCVDTNVCILEGLGAAPEEARCRVQPSSVLAEAFMVHPETAKGVFRSREPEQVVLDYLAGREVPGFGPIDSGARRLLDFVRNGIEPGTFSVFVTHDALMMPFRRHFLGAEFSRDNWSPFLGGCVIYTEGGRTWVNHREV